LSAPSSEVSRRTKVIGRVPGETSALCLISAARVLPPRPRDVVMTPKLAAASSSAAPS